jgi:pimeloyl-ACP methyl ester carboxylesterase
VAWFLLVPGACHGGWWFEPLVDRLRAAGHAATALTLAGLHPDGPPAPDANLDTHVGQVVAALEVGDEPAVLVGHSYAGAVITGAADRRPDLVAALVYLDAFVPEDGDSCWSMTNDWQREWYIDSAGATGLDVAPLPFFDPRSRPHPIGTLLQRCRLTGAHLGVARRHYVLAAEEQWLARSPFAAIAHRLRQDPTWSVRELDATHNLLATGPELLVDVLLDLAPTG